MGVGGNTLWLEGTQLDGMFVIHQIHASNNGIISNSLVRFESMQYIRSTDWLIAVRSTLSMLCFIYFIIFVYYFMTV